MIKMAVQMQMRELEMCEMRVSFSSTNAGCLYHRLSPLYQGGTKARIDSRRWSDHLRRVSHLEASEIFGRGGELVGSRLYSLLSSII
jgi:hypothetical protein